MAITPLPDPPSRADPVNFSARADVFLAALQVFSEQVSAFAAALDAGDSAAALAGNLASSAAGMGSALIDFSRALTVGGKVTAPRFEANNTDDSDTPDAGFRVNRVLGSGTAASGHGFRDQTTFSRAAGSSYAAYDGAVTVQGAADHGHYVSFQHRPVIDISGHTLGWDYSSFSGITVNSGSTVTARVAHYVADGGGAGTIGTNYGAFYVANQTKGLVNYSGYIANSDAPLYCGAPIWLENLLVIDPSAPFFVGGPTVLAYPYCGYNYNPRTGKYGATDVAVTQYFDGSGYTVLTAPSGTAGSACTLTPRLQVKLTGQMRLVPLTTDPAGGQAGDLYFNGTTNKHRGHNGTAWVDLY